MPYKHILCALAFTLGLSLSMSAAHAGACADPGSVKTSSVANIGSATTTAITGASSTTTRMYICNIFGSLAGTTPSVTFKYGSGTDCATAAVTLSGVILPTSGQMVSIGYGDDIFVIPFGNQLCGTAGGTGPSFQGVVTYVQK